MLLEDPPCLVAEVAHMVKQASRLFYLGQPRRLSYRWKVKTSPTLSNNKSLSLCLGALVVKKKI
jgi:hypothetical protein